MHVDRWLRAAVQDLLATGIDSARLDCLILLEDAIAKDRAWLLAHLDYEINDRLLRALNKKVQQRATHQPLAYIRNEIEFYGRTFYVDYRVLVPRPESETIIELMKSLTLPAKLGIADIGTGSGALAITAKLEFPSADVIATDIDTSCLDVASRNLASLNANVQLIKADLLEDSVLAVVDKSINVILANLPYVPNTYPINQAANHEPKLAIFGGADGLDLYRCLFTQIDSLILKPAFVLAESLPSQHSALADLAASFGYSQIREQDFVQVFGYVR